MVECAAIGVADGRWVEAVKALVIRGQRSDTPCWRKPMLTLHGNCDCTVIDPWHVSWTMRELVEGFVACGVMVSTCTLARGQIVDQCAGRSRDRIRE